MRPALTLASLSLPSSVHCVCRRPSRLLHHPLHLRLVVVATATAAAGRTTSPLPAVQYLRDQGVDVLIDNPLNALALAPLSEGGLGGGVHFAFDKIANVLYEEIEKEQESWQPGVWSSISLNYGSLSSTAPFAKDFLDDKYVGTRRFLYLAQAQKGCEFCFWMLHFRNRQRQSDISVDTPVSIRTDTHVSESVEINLTCMFDPAKTTCPDVVNGIRANIDNRVAGTSYSKYVNFPSCSTKQGTDWRSLYWGDNVPQLLKIKQTWDPKDMFNHCQSLTNTNANCCPFTPAV